MENIEKDLEKFIAKETTVIQEGFVNSYYTIKKLKYSLKYDVLDIKDQLSENYIRINLNQVYKIENGIEKIKLYLDNDIEITLEIKRQTIKSLS